MEFDIQLAHREFLSKHYYIELESLLSSDQIDALQKAIDDVVQRQEGYDLFRTSEAIRKITCKRSLAKLAASFLHTDLLRIAFDQYVATTSGNEPAIKGAQSIAATACAKPLAGVFVIRLSDEPIDTEIDQIQCPIPSKKGNLLFLLPRYHINWNALYSHRNTRLLFIGYALETCVYQLEPNDPHTHAWKKLGYVFGDRLNDSLHPVVYRRS